MMKAFLLLTILLFDHCNSHPHPLCAENGPCRCYDDSTRMVCHGQPLEEWWNPMVYGPHTTVTSLAILATTLLSPITSFRNFPNLRELEIQQVFKDNHCRQVFDENVFADVQIGQSLQTIKFVDLEILCTIPTMLHSLQNLERLEFRRTNLRLYNENDFAGLERLRRLTIANSLHDFGGPSVFILPPRIFSRLPNLIYLSLEGSENLQLHREIFDGLEHLTELTLKKCNLNDNHLSELDNLQYLEILDLSENQLTLFGFNNMFISHPNLKLLKLNGNRGIKFLDQNAFLGATNLLELHVSGAEIENFDLNFMQNTPQLRYLDGSDNYAPLYKITYPQANSRNLPKTTMNFCKSSIGFVDSTLHDFLIHGGHINISDNTIISCDLHQNGWLGELIHCHKKHGLIYNQNTKCTNGDVDSFGDFLQSNIPAVCKGIQNKPAAIVSLMLLFLFSIIVYYF